MLVSSDNIARAASVLKQDKLVALPTETVYGLGGNALSDTAVAAIYATKGRPQFNPLIVHVRDIAQAKEYAVFNEDAETLARHFWPGPLTLVLPRKKNCQLSLLVSAGMDTVAIRSPAHPVAQALLKESGLPIAAPSANRSGRISPTEASHVRDELGDSVMILDGGACNVGIESTVVNVTSDSPSVLRPGSILPQELAVLLGKPVPLNQNGPIAAPGMLASHYAPSKPVRLNVMQPDADEALLAFGPNVPEGLVIVQNLSPNGDLQEAAANLFRMLRLLDASPAARIAVMPIPYKELGIAINDRLKRAATPA